MIVHLGVVMIAVGLAASGSFAEQSEARMAPGDTRVVHGHEVTYVGYEERDSDPSRLVRATEVRVDGKTLEPRLQRFPNATQEIGKPAVRYGIGDTVYLALIQAPREADGTILLRIIVQPLVGWLWAGGAVMVLGTILSAFPGRRRRGTEPTSAPSRWDRRPHDDDTDPKLDGTPDETDADADADSDDEREPVVTG
jgi:cytochrome c-type biogenesis protein CcmF